MKENETWRELPGFEHYLVSSQGRLKHKAHKDARGRHRTEQLITKQIRDAEYKRSSKSMRKSGFYTIFRNGERFIVSVPEAVCAAFMPEFSAELHKVVFANDDYFDCRLENMSLTSKIGAALQHRLRVLLETPEAANAA